MSIGFSLPTGHRSQPTDAPMCLCCHCRVCYSSYRMEKNGPPPDIATNDEDVRRWRITVRVARMWLISVAIAKMRISASRFKVGIDTDRQTAGAPPPSPLPGLGRVLLPLCLPLCFPLSTVDVRRLVYCTVWWLCQLSDRCPLRDTTRQTAKELQASKTRVARGGERLGENMKWGTARASKMLTSSDYGYGGGDL